jgi:pSer/pThr/pTyr-binding forkhead associated (FHA) protein
MNGPLEGKRFEVSDAQELVIGREEDVDVILDQDDLVSRRHAKVRRDWSGTAVEDLGSRNGIKVNRKKVLTAPLKDRDEIEVGNTRFLFLDPSEVREAPVVSERPKSKPAQPAAPAPAEEPPPEEAKDAPEEPEAEPEEEEKPESAEEKSSVSEVSAVSEVSGASNPGADEADPSVVQPAPVSAVEQVPMGLTDRLGARLPGGDWRKFLPLIVVGGIALFALGLLAVTFFVM